MRRVVGGRPVTACAGRGGWSPAPFADSLTAGFDLLTYRNGPAADLPAAPFTRLTCADDRGREHSQELAGAAVTPEAARAAQGPAK